MAIRGYRNKFTTTTPKKEKGATTPSGGGTPQSAMTNKQLQSKGPGYGSQATRVANTQRTALGVPQALGTPGGTPGVANSDWARVGAGGPQAIHPFGVNPNANPGASTYGGASGAGQPHGTSLSAATGQPMSGAVEGFGYTPQGLGMLYDNPVSLAQDILASLGINNYGMAQALADAFGPALYAFMMQGKGLGDVSDAATLNYITDYLTNFTTPGGRMPAFSDLMASLLGSGDPSSSPLAADLSSLAPADQVQAMRAYMQAAGYGNNPLAQRAYGRAADYFGDQYLGGVMKGDPGADSYAAFLAGSPLAKWVRR